jgi:hypothetical protein
MVSFTVPPLYLGTHWIGGWVGPTVSSDVVAKEKSLPCREWNPDRPAFSQLLYLCKHIVLSILFLLLFLSACLLMILYALLRRAVRDNGITIPIINTDIEQIRFSSSRFCFM